MKMREFDFWAGFGWKSHRRDFGYCKISGPGEKKERQKRNDQPVSYFRSNFLPSSHRPRANRPTGRFVLDDDTERNSLEIRLSFFNY